jgi:hypothetical protein
MRVRNPDMRDLLADEFLRSTGADIREGLAKHTTRRGRAVGDQDHGRVPVTSSPHGRIALSQRNKKFYNTIG